MTSTSEVFQEELTITVRGDEYVFRTPSIRYDIEIAARASSIRRKADPEGASPYDLGGTAVRFSYALATLELYLKAGPAWVFSAGTAGKPVVAHEKFAPNKGSLVSEIGEAFDAEYARFLAGGATDDGSAGA